MSRLGLAFLILTTSLCNCQHVLREVTGFCRQLHQDKFDSCMQHAVLNLKQVYDFCMYSIYRDDDLCQNRVSTIDWHNIQRQILETSGTIEGGTNPVVPEYDPHHPTRQENPYAQNFFIPHN